MTGITIPRLATITVIAAALLLPAAAGATTWGSAASRARPYTDFAQTFWAKRGGYIGCPSGVRVEWGAFDANATWGWGGDCLITISPARWRTLNRGWRCHLLLHEWGHLIGLGHAAGWRDIMFVPFRYQNPACGRFNRIASARAGRP